MARAVPSRALRNEETRDRLLQAARRVFVKRGYAAATLAEICEAAELTTGAVYSRFGSKADLMLALLERRIEQREREIAEIAAAAPTPEEAMTRSYRHWSQSNRADRDWGLLILEFRVQAARDPALNARYAPLHARLQGALSAFLQGTLDRLGATPGFPLADAAALVTAVSNGAMIERWADPSVLGDEIMDTIHLGLWRMLSGAATPQRRATRRRST